MGYDQRISKIFNGICLLGLNSVVSFVELGYFRIEAATATRGLVMATSDICSIRQTPD